MARIARIPRTTRCAFRGVSTARLRVRLRRGAFVEASASAASLDDALREIAENAVDAASDHLRDNRLRVGGPSPKTKPGVMRTCGDRAAHEQYRRVDVLRTDVLRA